jgi:hypothetical protein
MLLDYIFGLCRLCRMMYHKEAMNSAKLDQKILVKKLFIAQASH